MLKIAVVTMFHEGIVVVVGANLRGKQGVNLNTLLLDVAASRILPNRKSSINLLSPY